MTEPATQDLVRTTVFITKRAADAIDRASVVTSESRNQTVSRALYVYEGIVSGVVKGHEWIVFQWRPGGEGVRLLLPEGQRRVKRTTAAAVLVAWFALLAVAGMVVWLVSQG